MRTNKLGLRSTKNWVQIQLEKERKKKVLKYFEVENGDMCFHGV